MSSAAALAAALAAVVSLGRWLRVSQREHYLPGSVLVTARRWITRRPPNGPLALAWAVLAAASVSLAWSAEGAAAFLGIVAAVVGALFPIGMSIAGRPRLRLTRRVVYQGLTASVLSAGAIVAVAWVLDVGPAAALAPVIAALSVDVAASLNRPIERRNAARYRREADAKLTRVKPRVIAITGSYGKTSVKNHVRDLVGSAFDTLATPASWNNLAGLSRAINEQLTPSTEVFIAEMGTYGPGEIRELAEWLKPEVAVITAVGPVHLERMRTLETIAAAKAEILPGARAAVICIDSPILSDVAERVKREGSVGELWIVGSGSARPELDVSVSQTREGEAGSGPDTLTVWVRGERLGEVPRGSLHAGNVACAVAAALAIGVDRRIVASALPKLTASASRAAVATTENGLTVVDDTFNSNPFGAAAALSTLTRLVANGRRVVITPGMVEMGDMQFDANKQLGEEVAAKGGDLVVVGWTNRTALMAGHPGGVAVRDRDAARSWVRANLQPGDGVLWENDLPDHYP